MELIIAKLTGNIKTSRNRNIHTRNTNKTWFVKANRTNVHKVISLID